MPAPAPAADSAADFATHPFAVWEHTATGRVLRTFPDEDLAAQFCVNNGGQITPNPCNW